MVAILEIILCKLLSLATSHLSAYSASDIEKKQYIKESLYYLVLHEVGHTFGLNHNMKSSQLHDLANVHNKEVTSKNWSYRFGNGLPCCQCFIG